MYQAGGRPHLSSRQPKSKDFGKRSTSTGSSKNDGSIREVPRLPAVLGGPHPPARLLPRARAPPLWGAPPPRGTKLRHRPPPPPPPPPAPRPAPPPFRGPPPRGRTKLAERTCRAAGSRTAASLDARPGFRRRPAVPAQVRPWG